MTLPTPKIHWDCIRDFDFNNMNLLKLDSYEELHHECINAMATQLKRDKLPIDRQAVDALAHSYATWKLYDKSGRQNFVLGPAMCSLLANTKVNLHAQEIKLPFTAFWVSTVQPNVPWKDDPYGFYMCQAEQYITISYHYMDSTYASTYSIDLEEAKKFKNLDLYIASLLKRAKEDLNGKYKGDIIHSYQELYKDNEQLAHMETFLGWSTRLALNLCIYLGSQEAETKAEKYTKDTLFNLTKSSKNKRVVRSIVWIGNKVEKGLSSDDLETLRIAPVAHWVRGHWRRPSPQMIEPRNVWVRPHRRGSDAVGVVKSRLYRFTQD